MKVKVMQSAVGDHFGGREVRKEMDWGRRGPFYASPQPGYVQGCDESDADMVFKGCKPMSHFLGGGFESTNR